MIYHVSHSTRYRYAGSVPMGFNRAVLTPRNSANQQCIRSEIRVGPVEGQFTQQVTDFFGNQVNFFSVAEPHESLEIIAKSDVRITPTLPPVRESSPSWESVRDGLRLRLQIDEETLDAFQFVFPSPQIPLYDDLRDYALQSFTPKRPIIDAGAELTQRIHEDFKYDPTATTVATPLDDVVAKRRGVCQDFAHLEISCLRSIGLAARYVSGYIAPRRVDGEREMVGAYASHAWLSLYSPGHGWIDLDPTNNMIPSSEHITIGWAREYTEISPMRGIILGGGEQLLGVSVQITRD